MNKILKKLLDEVIKIEEIDEGGYADALYHLFCGVGTLSEYKAFLSKWFTEPDKLYDMLDDVENICVFKISKTELKVLVFSDGYEGYLFTFGVDNGKLKILLSKEVDENDSIFDKDELEEDEINEIMCE